MNVEKKDHESKTFSCVKISFQSPKMAIGVLFTTKSIKKKNCDSGCLENQVAQSRMLHIRVTASQFLQALKMEPYAFSLLQH